MRPGKYDYALLTTVMILLGIGIVMVFSSSHVKADQLYGDLYFYLKRQSMWVVLGLSAMFTVSNIDYWRYQRYSRLILAGTILLLFLVLFIGVMVNDARRWIDVGLFRLQPSELTKLAFVLYIAERVSRKGVQVSDFWRGLVPPLAILGGVFILILAQPDLGTALAIAGTVVIMLFVGGAKMGHLIGLGIAAVPLLYWAVMSEDYRRRRFFAFLDPWQDRLGSGYHIIQSLYAIGSGGFFGLGLGHSRQKFFYLPEQHTDFIFAIISEELGFIGASVIIILFFFFAWRGFRIAMAAPDHFSSMVAVGITTMITLQALINIGVVTASIPITGIPLPFISYGGSSLLFTLIGVGILLNISKYSTR